jgi:3-keto-disaccharide hydrolase
MNRLLVIAIGLVIIALVHQGAYQAAAQGKQAPAGWTTLFDGKSLAAFNMIGDANWQLVDGVVQANKGNGFLLTKGSYGDFELKRESAANHRHECVRGE